MFVESVSISCEGKTIVFKLFVHLQPCGIEEFVQAQEEQSVLAQCHIFYLVCVVFSILFSFLLRRQDDISPALLEARSAAVSLHLGAFILNTQHSCVCLPEVLLQIAIGADISFTDKYLAIQPYFIFLLLYHCPCLVQALNAHWLGNYYRSF